MQTFISNSYPYHKMFPTNTIRTTHILYVLGGAGGKGVWGKPGSEIDAAEFMDEKDPNYDSDSLDNGDVTLEAIVPQLSEVELHKHVEPIILEYYEHGVTKEA